MILVAVLAALNAIAHLIHPRGLSVLRAVKITITVTSGSFAALTVLIVDNKHRRTGMTIDKDTLEWAARWIEDSLKGETDERVIEFGRNMAMSLRAAGLPPAGEVANVT